MICMMINDNDDDDKSEAQYDDCTQCILWLVYDDFVGHGMSRKLRAALHMYYEELEPRAKCSFSF